MTCKHCGKEIHKETDDMITCGGAFDVWYHERKGKRAMRCYPWCIQVHEPLVNVAGSDTGK